MISEKEFAALMPQIFEPRVVARIKGETRNGHSSLRIVRIAVRLGLQEIRRARAQNSKTIAELTAEFDKGFAEAGAKLPRLHFQQPLTSTRLKIS